MATVLMLLALIAFVLAAFAVPAGRVQLVPLGLAFFIGALLVGDLWALVSR